MDRDDYTDASYTRPHVPPTTAPAIDRNAVPHDAAAWAKNDGDSDYPGTHEASVRGGGKDANVAPGQGPAEIVPDGGDRIEPAQPDEISPAQPDEITPDRGGDTAAPGRAPEGTPPPPD